MALSKSKSTSSAPKAAASSASAPSAPSAHTHADLEKKLASLEAAFAAHCAQSEKEHAALEAKCNACCEAKSSGGPDPRVEKIWKWLMRDRIFRSL